MTTFGYTALDKAGKEIKGSIEADSEDKARSDLNVQGLIIMSLGAQSALTKDINLEFGGKPTPRDLSVFCRQFVSMTRAGVSIIEAMKMLSEQTENKRLQKATDAVRANIEKGETLANSLAEHPDIYPSLMINLVAAGEASGSLDIALERMAGQFEKTAKTRALLKKAMIYPCVVAIVAIAVVIVMLVVVIPQYAEMFVELDTELPALTRGVQACSNFLINFWFIIIPVVVAAVIGIRLYAKSNSGKHLFGKISLKVPGVKDLTTKSASSLMARTLSTLLAAGVPLNEAVDIVSGTMDNIWFKEALIDTRDEIMIGVPMSIPLQKSGMFPPMVYHMVRIGEESGNTEDMLDKLADYYDEEVEMAVQSMMAAMEPMIIIVLAVVVGTLVGACIAPMLTMYQALDSL